MQAHLAPIEVHLLTSPHVTTVSLRISHDSRRYSKFLSQKWDRRVGKGLALLRLLSNSSETESAQCVHQVLGSFDGLAFKELGNMINDIVRYFISFQCYDTDRLLSWTWCTEDRLGRITASKRSDLRQIRCQQRSWWITSYLPRLIFITSSSLPRPIYLAQYLNSSGLTVEHCTRHWPNDPSPFCD